MTDGDRVEHIVHKIRGAVRGESFGQHVSVTWDDDGSPTESGQRYLDTHRDGDSGPVYLVVSLGFLRLVSAVEQLGELT